MEKLLVESVDMPDARRPDRLTILLPEGLVIRLLRVDEGYRVDAYYGNLELWHHGIICHDPEED